MKRDQEILFATMLKHEEKLGGAGSGNFGHSGRPGEVGGSGEGGGGGGGSEGKIDSSNLARHPSQLRNVLEKHGFKPNESHDGATNWKNGKGHEVWIDHRTASWSHLPPPEKTAAGYKTVPGHYGGGTNATIKDPDDRAAKELEQHFAQNLK